MSSDFKCNFWSVAEQIFELRATKSRCLGVRGEAHANGKSLGSIRGRQATVYALIGNEHNSTIRHVRISIQSRRPNSSEHSPKIGHYLLTPMIAFWLQLPSSSSHKNRLILFDGTSTFNQNIFDGTHWPNC